MNLYLRSFAILSAFLAPFSAQAGLALFPHSTDRDLVQFGEDRLFLNVYEIVLTKKNNSNAACSAVKVDIDLESPIYLTAAHCLRDINTIRVEGAGEFQPSHFMIHHFHETNPIDDLAAFWNPKDKTKSGYSIYKNKLASIPHEKFLHVGFGVMRNGSRPKQAFFTCPMSFDQELKQVSAECPKKSDSTKKQITGKLTPGDSGGGLFVYQDDGQIELVGVGMAVVSEVTAFEAAFWRLADEDFVSAVKKVFERTKHDENTLLIDYSISEPSNLSQHPKVLLALGDTQKDPIIARSFYVKAGEFGASRLCRHDFAEALKNKNHSEQRNDLISRCLLGAKNGDAESLYLLSRLYAKDTDLGSLFEHILDETIPSSKSKSKVADDRKTSDNFLLKAIEKGSLRALRYKAEKGDIESIKILAQYGDADQQYKLAESYLSPEMYKIIWPNNWFVEHCCKSPDPKLAMQWLTIAVEGNNKEAKFALAKLNIAGFNIANEGHLVVHGSAISQYALDLLHAASIAGQEDATLYLGELYSDGKLVKQDPVLAARYWALVIPAYVFADATKELQEKAIHVLKTIGEGQWLPIGKARENIEAILKFHNKHASDLYLAPGFEEVDLRGLLDSTKNHLALPSGSAKEESPSPIDL